MSKSKIGTIGWVDLTVENAGAIRDFYQKVIGWESDDLSMGEYADYNMLPDKDADPVAGVCHARGTNQGMPAQWMIYVYVADLDKSMDACMANGGKILQLRRDDGFCVIQDPSGAVMALYQENESA